jgi:ketosteroid isomerase-like protein
LIASEKNKETGEEFHAEDAIIFEFEGGKIKYWQEYIDKEPRN